MITLVVVLDILVVAWLLTRRRRETATHLGEGGIRTSRHASVPLLLSMRRRRR